MPTQTVLVTGAAGYVGSILCRQLLADGHHVRAIDLLLFGGESLLDCIAHPRFSFVHGDLCDSATVTQALEGVTAVVHLAAIVGDPACKAHPDTATRLMDQGSRQLHQLARSSGVRHFIFASTCSNYGLMEGGILLTEDSPLQPQSHYARLKVGFEQYLIAQAASPSTEGMGWTILRFATAYGHSPRPRFDLTVNHFTRDLSLGRELEVFAADLWRPYCHVHDLARAAALMVELGPSVHGRTYNVGHSDENHTKRSIVEAVRTFTSAGQVRYQEGNGGDTRNYRVDFSRIARECGFSPAFRLPDGIRELHTLIRAGLLPDPFSDRYRNA